MTPERKSLKRKWLLTGGLGAFFLGVGVSVCIECGFLKHDGAPLWQWAFGGTLGLLALIFGVVMLIKAGHLEGRWKQGE